MDSFLGKYWNNREMARRTLYAAFGLGIVGTGDIYLVKKSTDADYEEWLRMFPSANIFTTYTLAMAACTSGKSDIIVGCPGTFTEALTWNKNDVSMIGLGGNPYGNIIDGDGSIGITLTGTNARILNMRIVTAGAAVACVYGTGLLSAPKIGRCYFENLTLTSIALVNIAGATSRGLDVQDNIFLGASTSADAVNYAGKAGKCYNNTAEGLHQTEGTCFAVNGQFNNEAGS